MGFSAVLVISDPARRSSVARRLSLLGADRVVSFAGAGEAKIRSRGVPSADLVIADAVLSDGSGADLAHDLVRQGWRGSLILVEGQEQLSKAIAHGDRAVWLTRSLCRMPSKIEAATRGLSDREIEVLGFVAQGNSNREIGERMSLSPLTIKSHLARIARKLGTGDRAGLVATATRAGVIS
jgi:DNA-binding NarL/FixJ family response regulator